MNETLYGGEKKERLEAKNSSKKKVERAKKKNDVRVSERVRKRDVEKERERMLQTTRCYHNEKKTKRNREEKEKTNFPGKRRTGVCDVPFFLLLLPLANLLLFFLSFTFGPTSYSLMHIHARTCECLMGML